MGIVDEDIVVASSRHRRGHLGAHAAEEGRTPVVGLCPFHAEKTPSFSVNQEEGVYYCFGCQAKRRRHHLRARDRAPRLRRRRRVAGRPRPASRCATPTRTRASGRKRRTALVDAMAAGRRLVPRAAARPRPTPAPARALPARPRASTATSCASYRIGWAPDGWDELARALAAARRRARRRRARVREQPQPPAGLLPGPGAVPDLRRPGRPGRLRRADAARATSGPSTGTRPRRALYAKSKVALRPQLGQGRHRAQPTRSSSARATPTSSASPRPACPAPWPPAAPPSPRSTCGC